MELCRACLKNDFPENMILMDKSFVKAYNLLTNLNVALLDGITQYSCEDCSKTLAAFMIFREKCISSEHTLQQHSIEKIKVEDNSDPEDLETNPRRSARIRKVTKKCDVDDFLEKKLHIESTDNASDMEILLKTEIKVEKLESFLEEDINDNYEFEAVDQEELKDKKSKKKSKKVKVSQERKELSCGLCNLTFPSTETAEHIKHVESHQSETQCMICKESCESWPELFGHRLEHLKIGERYCYICKKRFRTSASLEYHFRKLHLQMEDPSVRCKKCLKMYENPKKLKKHMWRSHTSHRKGQYCICDICSKTFKNKSLIISHLRSHYDLKRFTCDTCGKSYKQYSGLQDHISRKHCPDKQTCKACKRVFPNEEKLNKHKCGEGTVICPKCGLIFLGKRKLKSHMRRHAPVKYQCSRCSAAYKTKGALQVHENRHDKIRTFKCEYCEYSFYGLSTLIKHRRIHTGEKPYKCTVCSKGFTANHNLKVHMRVHGFYNLIVKKNQEEPATKSVDSWL